MKFCFVILHYLEGAVKDTFECVDSISRNLKREDYNIILIDNGSNDNSLNLLCEKFKSNIIVDVIALQNNEGFAKGNNFGARFAIDRYSPEFLIIINNDTLIIQPEFLNLIESEYFENKFDVVGPYIYDKKLRPQNPMQIQPVKSVLDIEEKISYIVELKLRFENRENYYNMKIHFKNILYKFKGIESFVKKINDIRLSKKYLYNPNQACENVPLHGSALIFSKDFFNSNNHIFYPETFLYAEEEILFFICNRDNKIMRYQPKIMIHHKEDASSNALFHSNYDKQIFIYEQHLNSYKVFKNLLINEKGNVYD